MNETMKRVPAILAMVTKADSTITDAGLDYSNNPMNKASLPPIKLNASAFVILHTSSRDTNAKH